MRAMRRWGGDGGWAVYILFLSKVIQLITGDGQELRDGSIC